MLYLFHTLFMKIFRVDFGTFWHKNKKYLFAILIIIALFFAGKYIKGRYDASIVKAVEQSKIQAIQIANLEANKRILETVVEENNAQMKLAALIKDQADKHISNLTKRDNEFDAISNAVSKSVDKASIDGEILDDEYVLQELKDYEAYVNETSDKHSSFSIAKSKPLSKTKKPSKSNKASTTNKSSASKKPSAKESKPPVKIKRSIKGNKPLAHTTMTKLKKLDELTLNYIE